MSATESPQVPAFASASIEVLIQNLHKSFGANKVLSGIDLSIKSGEMVAIVGGSGCGKTVLLKHMIGQMPPDQGRVCLADHEADGSPLVDLATLDNDGMDRLRIHWGVVFQRNALISGTVEENITLPLELVKGLDRGIAQQRASRSLEAVGLDAREVLQLNRDQLSGGMAKRVAIARALASEPLLMFYDEPTTGLDPEHVKLIHTLIAQSHSHNDRNGLRTTIIITHDKELLYRLRPRIVLLHDGKVFFDGTYPTFASSDSSVIRPYFELMPVLHRRPIPSAMM